MTYPTVGQDRVGTDIRRADFRFSYWGLSPLTRLLNFDLARDCPIEHMHLITNVVRRLVGKLLQRQNLEPGVTVDELDDARFKNLTCFVTPKRKRIFFVSKASGPGKFFANLDINTNAEVFQTFDSCLRLVSSDLLFLNFTWLMNW